MDLKEEIKDLAIKHNLTQSEVKKIFYSQFKFVAHIMSNDYNNKPINERRSIKLRGFGTFEFSKYRAERLTKLKQLKDDRQRNMGKEIA